MKGIQKIYHESTRYLKRQSPTILTFVAAIGVVATAITVARAAPKAVRLLEEATDEKGEELTKLESVCVAGPVYITPIIIGTSTIACMFGANVLNKKQQASLISSYALLENSFKKYRNAANTVYGDDADAKIKAEVAKNAYVSADGFHLYSPELDLEDDKSLFYDCYSQRYFRATMSAVINAQYHINRNLRLRGYVSVNELYDFIGIEQIDGGDDIGWSADELFESGIAWLDFDNRHTSMEDGIECYVMSAIYEPTLLYID